jgi:hypothetical protein
MVGITVLFSSLVWFSNSGAKDGLYLDIAIVIHRDIFNYMLILFLFRMYDKKQGIVNSEGGTLKMSMVWIVNY